MWIRILFLIVASGLAQVAFSQPPAWTWVKQIGGPNTEGNGGSGYDGGHTCVSDAEGNVYVTGHFNSGVLNIGPYALTNSGNPDVFVAKYDSTGVVQWARKAGGNGYDEAYGIAVDTAGSVYVTGGFQSQYCNFDSMSLANTNTSGTYSDVFLAKYDVNGNLQWARAAGTSTANDAARSVTVDSSGNAYITGTFGGTTIFFDSYPLTNGYFLTKYDPNGNVIWAKGTVSGFANAYSNSIDGNGNVYVTGVFYVGDVVFDNDTLTNDTTSGSADIFVTKYDSSGAVVWARRAGGNRADMAYCIHSDSDGNTFVTGGSYSPSFNFGSNSFFNADNTGSTYDVYFLKFDAAGNEIWVQRAGGTYSDVGASITTDISGNIYLTGNFASSNILFGTTMLTNTSTYTGEIFVVKFSPAGNAIWAKQVTGNANDFGRSITSNPLGDVYTSGNFASASVSFGNYNFFNAGYPYSDSYVAKIGYDDLTTSIGQQQDVAGELMIYPNPGDGIFYLRTDVALSAIEIRNALGQIVYENSSAQNNEPIDLSSHPPGVYFIHATTIGQIVMTGRIILR